VSEHSLDLIKLLEETSFEPSFRPSSPPMGETVLDERPQWLIDAADLLAEPDPGPTPWLVDDLIIEGALIAAVGRWKTTKSYGLLELCLAVATGRPAFGKLAVQNPGPVVFVNEESGRAALWRRLDALCRGRATDPEQLRRRLYVAPNARVKLDDLGWQNELVSVGRDLQPRLILFDPLARMKSAVRDESAQNEMATVLEFLRYLRDQTGAAVGFVQHTGHQGEHMRGSSDLESVWETRLAWKRDGESPVVTVESAHREAESIGAISYRIDWDHETRSMRFELETDPVDDQVGTYLLEHPEASANEVFEAVGGNRGKVLAAVKRLRAQGGTEESVPPRNHPPRGPSGVVPPDPPPPLGGGVGVPPSGPGTGFPVPPPDDEGAK